MALVWLEFVKELRWHWEERVQIPAVATAQIDYNSCLLYQKLQMVSTSSTTTFLSLHSSASRLLIRSGWTLRS